MRDDRRVKNIYAKVGEYRLGEDDDYIAFSLTYKPNWFRRIVVKLIFDMRWIDYDTIQDNSILKVHKNI